MPSIVGVVPIDPVTTVTSALLQIPPSNSQQILKYVADFSVFPSPLSAIPGFVFNPGSKSNFGTARMVKIDARWLLQPVSFSLSDSLADIITIMPGDYELFTLDGVSGDTFAMLGNFPASPVFQFGYVKLYFYNYLDLDVLPRRSKQSIVMTSYLVDGLPGMEIQGDAGGIGLPIIEEINFFANLSLSAGTVSRAFLTPTIFANQGWVGPNPWEFTFRSAIPQTFNLKPKCVLPPANAAVVPVNDNNPTAYNYVITPTIGGTGVTGQAEFYVRYRFN